MFSSRLHWHRKENKTCINSYPRLRRIIYSLGIRLLLSDFPANEKYQFGYRVNRNIDESKKKNLSQFRTTDSTDAVLENRKYWSANLQLIGFDQQASRFPKTKFYSGAPVKKTGLETTKLYVQLFWKKTVLQFHYCGVVLVLMYKLVDVLEWRCSLVQNKLVDYIHAFINPLFKESEPINVHVSL